MFGNAGSASVEKDSVPTTVNEVGEALSDCAGEELDMFMNQNTNEENMFSGEFACVWTTSSSADTEI